MLRVRYDAIAQEKIPDQLSRLVDKIGVGERFAAARKQRAPQTTEAEPTQQRSFVTCPFCLGMGQRAGANAAQPAVFCSQCKGRGFLDYIPKATDL